MVLRKYVGILFHNNNNNNNNNCKTDNVVHVNVYRNLKYSGFIEDAIIKQYMKMRYTCLKIDAIFTTLPIIVLLYKDKRQNATNSQLSVIYEFNCPCYNAYILKN